MLRTLPPLAALAIVIVSGVVHGVWTGQRSASRAPGSHAAGLRLVPTTIGDWEGQDLTLDPRSVEVAEISDYLMRRYENRRGDAVTILLVCGRPGPISAHTPEVCYAGAGYDQAVRSAKLGLGSGSPEEDDRFWVADFSKRDSIVPEYLRVLYAWSDDGTWRAADLPRLDFAGSPELFKLYAVRQNTKVDESPRDDPSVQLLRQLLPELRESLFPTPRPTGRGATASASPPDPS